MREINKLTRLAAKLTAAGRTAEAEQATKARSIIAHAGYPSANGWHNATADEMNWAYSFGATA